MPEITTNEVDASGLEVWTVGHSTRSQEEFREILLANEIELLVDVRSYPGSRRYPQFKQQQLAEFLKAAGIDYRHLPSLGGRRRPIPNSVNIAWRNASFRAYADYMGTDDFKSGIQELLELAQRYRVALMCAEAVWWRCHRSLIADYLKSIGVTVTHILSGKKNEPHRYTAPASIVDGELSYRGLLK